MGVSRRKGSPHWWYDFSLHGRRFRGSTFATTREEAEIVAAKLRSDVLIGATTGKKPRLTLDGACARYWTEHGRHSRAPVAMASRIKRLLKAAGRAIYLDEINDDVLSRLVAKRRGKVADATVNRDLTILRAIVNRARAVWGVEVAQVNWRLHRLAEPDHRTRYLTPAEAKALVAAAAPHLKPIISAALFTGLRRGNVLGLDWSQVDLNGRMITVRAKSARPGGKVVTVPIAEPLLIILNDLGPQERGPVFTLKCRPIGDVKHSFKSAVRRAGIADCRFHDLRHTAASWMVDQGVPLDVVQKILGHSTIALTQRYAHRRLDAQREAVDAIGRRWGSDGIVSTQTPTKKGVSA